MVDNKIDQRLFDKGWSQSRLGLWHRPFPNDKKAGIHWIEAARIVGFDEQEIETELNRRENKQYE